MDEDAELAAIRAKMQREMMAQHAEQPQEETPATPILVDLVEEDFEGFVRAHENVVVDCWAPWCGPCRIVSPIVEELSRDMAGRVAFAKVNVDVSPHVSRAFGIQSIPTLLVFRKGRLVDRIVGAQPKARFAALIERQLGGRRGAGSPGPRRL